MSQTKAISYALFDTGKHEENCFSVDSYIRGIMINLRLNRLIYPDWITILHINQRIADRFNGLFEPLVGDRFEVHIENDEPLCKAMLWRLKPIFHMRENKWRFSHVICRDLDSPTTYREAQAVQYWINRDTAAHAITDSVSHTIPMLGGMVGFRPAYITERLNCRRWEYLFNNCSIDFTRKGSDQDFLNRNIYPSVAQQGSDSITQHYFKGHPNTWLSDFRTCLCEPTVGHVNGCPNNQELSIPVSLKETNAICGHIGASGAYTTVMETFLRKYSNEFNDILKAESQYPDVFYWVKQKQF